jgi:UDP-N-acetylmuramoylalanine--D-glutamate ligase
VINGNDPSLAALRLPDSEVHWFGREDGWHLRDDMLYRGRRIAILVGGHDRGVDWDGFADAMRQHAPVAIVTMGQNGPRIHALLAPLAATAGFVLAAASDLGDAMHKARTALGGDGVMLLSPGAPSFGAYRDYTERGRDFARLAGFDPDAISAIPGLGIA